MSISSIDSVRGRRDPLAAVGKGCVERVTFEIIMVLPEGPFLDTFDPDKTLINNQYGIHNIGS